ncbi:MAG: TonB-dependent receptor [Prevotellaceae bacterium]|jgi:outer membrane receptor protein involved in Fe transport|nr:TonB-dependent receptor [Prevotellaceae bacterium]
MTTQPIIRNFILFFFSVSSFSILFANPVSKEIRGYVHDAATLEPIIGATVLIKETNHGVATDQAGHYSISGVDDNRCTLIFSYLSYKTVEIECNLQKSITDVTVTMENDIKNIDAVVVKGRMRSHTENGMVLAVKAAPQVTSGISAVQIAKSPDRIASEVVRRIPGITIIDDRFIIVRGLSQRYNNAWINGLAVPSTETDSRAFPFDLIPSSQIDNLLVYKSPSPEIPGDFSGGFVQISSKDVPDANGLEFGYTTGINVNTPFDDFKLNQGGNTDFLGFDLNKRPLSGSFPTHLDMISEPSEITRLTRQGFNNDWHIKKIFPVPDQRLSFMIARRIETKNRTIVGNITSFTYSNTFKGIEGMKNARYGIYAAEADKPVVLDDYLDNQYTNDVRLGAMHNWSFVPNPSNRIEFKNLMNILGRNRLTERSGIKDMSSMYYRKETEMLYSSRLTYSGQFAGTHHLTSNRTFTWNVGYAYANNNEPDRRIVTNQTGIGSLDDIHSVEPGNENISRYFQELHDHIVSTSLNYKRNFTKFALKTGFYGEYRTRNYAPREFIYRYDNLTYEERQNYLKLPFQEMLNDRYLGADKVFIDEITRKSNAYSATVWHEAGYVTFDIPLGKLVIYTGVRFENHHTKLNYDRADTPSLILKTSKKINDRHWLPSANFTYRFTEKHQLRAAYGRSLNRPELREISPSVYFDFDLFSEIGGNENLKTASIDNLDLRYEFYPEQGETMSLSVFYKYFKNPIEWTFIDMGGSLRYNYENADRADSWGIELDIRKKLDFIGLKHFSLVMNGALIKSNVRFKVGEVVAEPDRPMQGQSPYIINIGLFYQSEKVGINASLLYNRIGKRIVGLGKANSIDHNLNSLIPNSYEMPRNVMDFTISKTFGRIEIRCSVKDIFSEAVVYKQFPKFEKDGVIHEREQITRQYTPGQSVALGVFFKIN